MVMIINIYPLMIREELLIWQNSCGVWKGSSVSDTPIGDC